MDEPSRLAARIQSHAPGLPAPGVSPVGDVQRPRFGLAEDVEHDTDAWGP